jgi:hypothetical protein
MIPSPKDDNARVQAGDVGKANGYQASELYFPSPTSVKGRVLGALLRGERLTHLDCWRRFGSARLSHHIYRLRGIGWYVQMIEETVTTSDAGRSAMIGIYFLLPDDIASAGERGQRYAAECARVEAERRAA